MKKNLFNRISPLLVIAFTIWFIYNQDKKNEKLDFLISKNGYYFYSIITNKVVTSGGTRSVKFIFVVEERKYEWERYISDEFYNKSKDGDTIIIKVLKSKLPYSLVCEELVYQHCFGKQPSNGWKELPKCK